VPRDRHQYPGRHDQAAGAGGGRPAGLQPDPAGAAVRGERAPACRDGAAGVARARRVVAGRSCAVLGRLHRALPAGRQRGRGGAPVRDRSGDRLRPVKKKQPPKRHPVDRSREVETFLEMLQAERGASQNTLDAYGRDLDDLQTFLARRKLKPAAAGTDALRAYLKALDYVGMTPRTVARRLSVLRQFYRFLLAERMREDDPASALDSPKLGRPLPKVLSRAEVDALIDTTKTQGDGGRMATLLEILYGTGLRVSELVTLPLIAVERDAAVLVVRGKGNKERLVPLSDPARTAIAAWLHVRTGMLPEGEKSRFLFPSRGKEGH